MTSEFEKLTTQRKDCVCSKHLSGDHAKYSFENGYGASVVCHSFSHGGDSGLLELAVVGPDGSLCYSTKITNDVIGWLSAGEVVELLKRIEKLESNGPTKKETPCKPK